MTHFPHVLQQTGHQTLTSTITELQWVLGELFNSDLTYAANREDVQFVQASLLHYLFTITNPSAVEGRG